MKYKVSYESAQLENKIQENNKESIAELPGIIFILAGNSDNERGAIRNGKTF